MKLTATKSGIKVKSMKRESFLPSDKEWLAGNPKISLGNKLGEGRNGAVYEIKGNPNLVGKVPRGFAAEDKYTNRDMDGRTMWGRMGIAEEYKSHLNQGLEKQPLFTPTIEFNLGVKTRSGKLYKGLIRPKVTVINDNTISQRLSNATKITRSQLEKIRQALIKWSEQGLYMFDGLQIGIDRVGRPIQYDAGFLKRSTVNEAFENNNKQWLNFLGDIGILQTRRKSEVSRVLEEYGSVEKS